MPPPPSFRKKKVRLEREMAEVESTGCPSRGLGLILAAVCAPHVSVVPMEVRTGRQEPLELELGMVGNYHQHYGGNGRWISDFQAS